MPPSTTFATRPHPLLTATARPQNPQPVGSSPVSGMLHAARFFLAAVALVGGLTACSGSTNSPGSTSSGSNASDVSFATNMIPHHAQAIEMADLALSQARSPEVVDLATAIKKAQQPEIDTMTGWLKGWGEPVPDLGSDDGMDHGMAEDGGMAGMDGMDGMDGMAGIMSAADMERLGSRTGRAFDTMWLTMMIEHHEGAIDMAKTEIADGASDDAISLAHAIMTAQRVEIETMNRLLDTLSR